MEGSGFLQVTLSAESHESLALSCADKLLWFFADQVLREPELAIAYENAPSGATPARAAPARLRSWAWAALMRRAFDLDVLACPRCGGRLRLLATLDDPRVVQRLLARLGLPTDPLRPHPAQPPPRPAADRFADVPI